MDKGSSDNGVMISSRLQGVGEYYFSKKLREIAKKRFNGAEIINLGIGSPDMSPPEDVIQSLAESVSEPGAHMYQSYKGIPELRIAFTEWYGKYFDVRLDPETEVLPLIGSKEGIMHISMAFIQEGDRVLVPNPGYPAYPTAARLAGGVPVEYKLSEENGWLPDPGSLENEGIENVKLMWINYPHMPTGAKANPEALKNIVDFACKHNIILVNDNPYSFILNDHQVSILASSNPDDLVLELNSLSKSHNMAGWRVGVALGNAKLLEQVLRFKSNMDSGMFKPVMKSAIVALKQDADWYSKINEQYKMRREKGWQLLDFIGCNYSRDQSGMFVWARIPKDWESGENFADHILENTGIFITPGFIFGDQGGKYIRISLCTDLPVWDKVLNQIKENIQPKILTK